MFLLSAICLSSTAVLCDSCGTQESVFVCCTGSTGASGSARDWEVSTHRLSGEKVVVFSQWTSMLDLVEIALEEDGYEFRLTGKGNWTTSR
jgi:SNF2 family DNA or RNA helicase